MQMKASTLEIIERCEQGKAKPVNGTLPIPKEAQEAQEKKPKAPKSYHQSGGNGSPGSKGDDSELQSGNRQAEAEATKHRHSKRSGTSGKRKL